jgi:hypothetical protein
MQKYIKVNFSPAEKAIRQLNNITITDSAVSKTDNTNNYCILKTFILEMLNENNKEITSTELIDIVSVKGNIFYEYRSEISSLLKIYDNLKYSINSSDKDKFINLYIQTRNVIEKINVQKSNLEIK